MADPIAATYRVQEYGTILGSGDSYGQQDEQPINPVNTGQKHNHWRETTLSVGGSPENKDDLAAQDLFLMYYLGGNNPVAQVTVPIGSVCNEGKLKFTPAASYSGTFKVRVALVDRVPTSTTLQEGVSWYEEHTAARHFPLHAQHEVMLAGARVSNDGAFQLRRPDQSSTILYLLDRLGPGLDEGVHSLSQSNLINNLTAGNAKFDEIYYNLRRNGTQAGDAWVEVWTASPTAINTGGGTLIATSQIRTLTSITSAIHSPIKFQFDDVIDLGAGDQEVYTWLRGTFGSEALYVGLYAQGTLANFTTVGRGHGLGAFPYLANHELPNISGPFDDSLNGNQYGATKTFTVSTWTAGVEIELTGLESILQAWFDDPLYDPTKPLLFCVEYFDDDDREYRVSYSAVGISQDGWLLELDFTPPDPDPACLAASPDITPAVTATPETVPAVAAIPTANAAVAAKAYVISAVAAEVDVIPAVSAEADICKREELS